MTTQSRKRTPSPSLLLTTFWTLAVFVLCLAMPLTVSAQQIGDQKDSLEKEFSAFKEKIQKAKESTAEKNAPSSQAAANPLGPAANLPVSSKGPAPVDVMMPPSTPQDMQSAMEAQAAEQDRQFREKAFKEALKNLLPLSKDEIRQTLGAFVDNRQAAETPIYVPTPETRIQTVSLDPTAEPLTIHVAPGYVTTVSILDASGAPWPVQDMSYAGKFTITPPESGGNVIRIIPMSAHGQGNLSVRFVDLITPVVFTLVAGIETVDYRLDIRLPKNGPLAKTPLIEFGGIDSVAGDDQNLSAVLDGVMPKEAEKLRVKGVDGRTTAWRVNDTVYLRTPLSLLSPTWAASASSADGTTVYTLNDAPVILLSDEGRMVQAHIVGADEVKP